MVSMTTIWHLTHAADWDRALAHGSYEMSTAGATLADVGFVHAAHPHQLETVALAVYAHDPEPLVALSIDTDELAHRGIDVREEPGDPTRPDELYPHVYGPLPLAAVRAAHPARVVADGPHPRLVVDEASSAP